jgi:hypothetical protein
MRATRCNRLPCPRPRARYLCGRTPATHPPRRLPGPCREALASQALHIQKRSARALLQEAPPTDGRRQAAPRISPGRRWRARARACCGPPRWAAAACPGAARATPATRRGARACAARAPRPSAGRHPPLVGRLCSSSQGNRRAASRGARACVCRELAGAQATHRPLLHAAHDAQPATGVADSA